MNINTIDCIAYLLCIVFILNAVCFVSIFSSAISPDQTDYEELFYNISCDLVDANIDLKEAEILLQFAFDDIESIGSQIQEANTELAICKKAYKYESDRNKPVPLQIAENIHEESDYLKHEWDCSDKTNEWVRRMRQQGYEANYTNGMYLNDGSATGHAWGCYEQCVELTNPRFIEGVEIGSKYIPQPWKQKIECEVC